MENQQMNVHTNISVRKPSNIQLWAAFLIMAAFVALFLASSNPLSADTGVTVQTTGATTSDLIDPTEYEESSIGDDDTQANPE